MDPLGPEAWRAAQQAHQRNQEQQQWALMQRLREELRIETRNDRVRERVLSLKMIQDHDRQVDRALLNHAPLPISIPRPEARNWFLSQDMAGDTGYVLQWLGALVKQSAPDNTILNEIDEWLESRIWREQPFEGHPNDALQLDENVLGMQLRWLGLVAFNPNDPNSQELRGVNFLGNERTWHSIKELFLFLNHLRLLERFIDPRNPETNQKPLPDGTNLESGLLRASWVLHRAWIRALHYRTLYAGDDAHGWYQLQDILKITKAFLESENMEIPKKRHCRPEFNNLYTVFNTVGRALSNFTTELFHETRYEPADVRYAQDETVLYNLRHGNFENLWLKHFTPLDHTFHLWAILLAHARDFEKRMDVEHIEDVLIDKRVVGYDEWYQLDQLLDGTDNRPDIRKLPTNTGTVFELLAEVSRHNKSRRHYLLLRDWSKKRPWHQLYYVINTAPGEQDFLLQTIVDFYQEISNLAVAEPPPHQTGPSPSRLSNVWASLFTLHPIASTSPTQLQAVNYDDGCVICFENFEHSQLIVQLHCKHLFHYTCIRDYWDVPGRHTFRCAQCGQGSVKWQLHEQASITPEVLDVWDNEDVTDANWAREHPDIQDKDSAYYIIENNKLLYSMYWEEITGRLPREVGCEMARVREARRKRNKERREGIARARMGIHGMNPPAPGDN